MTVKYREQDYHVSFCDMLYVSWEKMILWLKRQKRRIKLLFHKEDVATFIIVTFFFIVFDAITLYWGKHHVTTAEKPYTFFDMLWDTKEAYFTTVVVTFVTNAFLRIDKYRQRIRAQHAFYVATMQDFEAVFAPYLRGDKHGFYVLYNSKCVRDTINHIKANCSSTMQMNNAWRSAFQQVVHRLSRVEQEIIADNIVMYSITQDPVRERIDEARYAVNKILQYETIQTSTAINLLWTLKSIVDCLREPWRVDIHRNLRIMECLDKYSENEMKEDFYCSMFLVGHKFDVHPTLVRVRRKR